MKKILLVTIVLIYHIKSFALANPASVYCAKVGGKTIIDTLPSQDQIGICKFAEHQECEEWALFKKVCPVGGVNTQNLNQAERFCLILGGKLDNEQCVLANNKECNIQDLYNQTCSNN